MKYSLSSHLLKKERHINPSVHDVLATIKNIFLKSSSNSEANVPVLVANLLVLSGCKPRSNVVFTLSFHHFFNFEI